MNIQLKLTPFENHIFERLSKANSKTYIVGGAVRDAILGKNKNDADISTALFPEKVMELFSDFKINPKGLFFGTIEIDFAQESVEVTTLKKNVIVGENTTVEFGTSVERDAIFRDFTINALYLDPSWRLIDPLGGLKDLKKKILRPTPTFTDRLISDPVLAFRTARFVAQGYTPSEELIEIISNPKYHVHKRLPTPIRLARETQKALKADFKKYLEFLHETGALYYQMKILSQYRQVIQQAIQSDNPIEFLAKNAVEVLQSLHAPPQVYMSYRVNKLQKPRFVFHRY